MRYIDPRDLAWVLVVLTLGLVLAMMLSRAGDPAPEAAPSTTPIVTDVQLDSLLAADGSEAGDSSAAPEPSPAGRESARGSVATDARVEGDAGDTTPESGSTPSTTPHLLTVLLDAPEVSNPVEVDTGLTEDDLLALLASSPWPRHEWSNVVSVAHCESRFQPEAVGDNGRAVGLLQIRTDVHGRLVRTFDLTDPWANLVAGYVIYLEAGRSWWPWSCA